MEKEERWDSSFPPTDSPSVNLTSCATKSGAHEVGGLRGCMVIYRLCPEPGPVQPWNYGSLGLGILNSSRCSLSPGYPPTLSPFPEDNTQRPQDGIRKDLACVVRLERHSTKGLGSSWSWSPSPSTAVHPHSPNSPSVPPFPPSFPLSLSLTKVLISQPGPGLPYTYV